MSRTEALAKLLAHGGMGRADLLDCTRWTPKVLESALRRAIGMGWVRRVQRSGCGRGYEYEAAA